MLSCARANNEDSHLGEFTAQGLYALRDNGQVGTKRISQAVGEAALASGDKPMAVRFLLQQIEALAPGGSVELRVPPFGAVQCIGGIDHRRGTPPNVVELDPETFIALCQGDLTWETGVTNGKVLASGTLASKLADFFPLNKL